MNRKEIVYLTFDGLLQSLGESQVVRVVERLAQRGFTYSVVSLERSEDLAAIDRLEAMRRRLAAAGIEWAFAPYGVGSVRQVAQNFAKAASLVRKMLSRDTVLIHARGYHSALVALLFATRTDVPYLFDARGRWVDERVLGGKWFTNDCTQRLARAVERALYQRARAVVTLTRPHSDDIRGGELAYVTQPVFVIPTCADYGMFETADHRTTNDGLTLLVSGSNKPMCHHSEGMRLAREILTARLDARLLILSPQYRELAGLAKACGVPMDRVTACSASSEEMPAHLAKVDWAIHLVSTETCNRGMFPTKLAEFFASGVRPIHFGCNSDVTAWVEAAGTGIVLSSLAEAEILRAARHVAGAQKAPKALLDEGRQKTRAYLDLYVGTEQYQNLLQKILLGED